MNIFRLEISPLLRWGDARGKGIKEQIKNFLKINVDKVITRDVYVIYADITEKDAKRAAKEFANPIIQRGIVGETRVHGCNWLIRIGFKPGVTDNVGRTACEALRDIIGRKLTDEENVFSSIEYLIFAPDLSSGKVRHIARDLLANELIQTIEIFSDKDMQKPLPVNLPIVKTKNSEVKVETIDLNIDESALMSLSKNRMLALSLEEMKKIRTYFESVKNRDKVGLSNAPTDVELEAIAQTWSEHCKHKIFNAEINYIDKNSGKEQIIKSCFKTFIRKSTEEIAASLKSRKNDDNFPLDSIDHINIDWLRSVFHDNAGVISFNDKYDLVFKVETHNSPSALDPYGGAMTGIVGCNRDPLGTGQGANLLINVWGYCLASPFTNEKDVPEGLLHPRRLRDGIHKGVIDGGNQSGIPYGFGWEYFEDRYMGKPLVFCGTIGTLPKQVGKMKGYEKDIRPGDLIVMAGGRIGKDGIHGATFSSEELHEESPTQAVQIGDPIIQKKLSDFIYEARARCLYRFITDNGAGGLSSSIGEMSVVSGGCKMDLKKAPLKYAGLMPWEILLSEAQERMSFAVPPEHIKEFLELARKRDVEATVLGEFTDSGKFHILYGERTVAYLDLDFLHNGLPEMKLTAVWEPPIHEEPKVKVLSERNPEQDIINLISRLNICSNEYKARQYDHEVKGINVIKPFVGVERDVVSDATVFMPEPLSKDGIIVTAAVLPRYSDIDTYHMMASTIDLAVRRVIAVGGKLGYIAGLDNFCWPDPVQSEKTPDGEYKLAQLVRANMALYDYTKAFKVPCISGKDSMKNDCTIGEKKISIPPTVLFSVMAKIHDISKAVTLDLKKPGDIVYVVGETFAELGASEYFSMLGMTGNRIPKVDSENAIKIYNRISLITEKQLARSVHTPAIGGLAAAFAKKAIAGRLGLNIDIDKIPGSASLSLPEVLFSETNSRFVITVKPEHTEATENILTGVPFAKVGFVSEKPEVVFESDKFSTSLHLSLDSLVEAYKSPLAYL